MSVAMMTLGLFYYKEGGKPLFWNIDACLMAFPFFFAGYFYKERHFVLDKYLDDRRGSPVIFAICVFANLFFGYQTMKIAGAGLEMFDCSYGFAPFTYLSAFAGVLMVVIVSKWFTIPPLRYVGEHSLLYFAWHQTIVMPLAWTVVSHIQIPFSKTIPWAAYGISLALQTVIILVFLTLCNEMMRRTKLRFMLGKFGDD